VSRPESEHFLRGVDQAREQLDRADARLQILEQRAQRLTGGSPPAEGAAGAAGTAGTAGAAPKAQR